MKQATPLVLTPSMSPFVFDGSFSAAEFAAGFDLPVALVHSARGSRVKLAIADLYHDRAVARQSLCAFTRSMAEILTALDDSPLARALLMRAVEDGATIGVDPLIPPSHGYYYADHAHIDLGQQDDGLHMSEKGLSLYMTGFICGLRRHWQQSHGFAPALSLRPADYADHARLLTADSVAVLHMVAWELRAQGHTYLWRELIAGDLADVATVFEDSLCNDAHAQFNGHALKAAFNQWFALRERIVECDAQTLEMFDSAIVRTQGRPERKMIASAPLVRSRLQDMGLLPDGGNYLAGCLFTSLWYAGFDDEQTCARLRHIEQEVSQLSVFN